MGVIVHRRIESDGRDEVSIENPLPVTVENARTPGAPLLPVGQRRITTPLIVVPGLDTNAYGADDQVGTGFTVNVNCASGAIEGVILVDLGAQAAAAFDLLVFEASPTAVANNAAFDLVDSERGLFIGKITLPAANQTVFGSTETIGSVFADPLLTFTAPAGVLYCLLTTQGTPTYAVGDLSLRFVVRQD